MTDFKISDDLVLLGASTFGAAKDAQIHRGDAADIIEQRRGLNPQEWRIYERFVSFSDYDRLVFYIGGGPTLITAEIEAQSTVANQPIDLVLKSLWDGSSQGQVKLQAGSNILQLRGNSPGFIATPTGTFDFSGLNRFTANDLRLGRLLTTAADSIIIDIANPTGLGDFEDSHKIIQIGRARETPGGGQRAAQWNHFVDVVDAIATSQYAFQRVDPFTVQTDDLLTISDAGLVKLPFAGSALAIGSLPANSDSPTGDLRMGNAFLMTARNVAGSGNIRILDLLSGTDNLSLAPDSALVQIIPDIALGSSNPASTGSIRLPNSGDIVWRNANNDDDIPVFSFGNSDQFDIGDPSAPTALAQIRLRSPEVSIPAGRFEIAGSSTSALRVLDGSSALVFGVDTTNGIVRSDGKFLISVDDALAILIQKDGGGGPGQDIFAVDTSASGFPPGNIVRVISAHFRQETASGRNTFGTSTAFDYVFLRIAPSQVISGGASDEAHILLVEGNIQGFSGDTTRINVATFTGSVTTQNVAEAVANISQVQIDEPAITLQGSSTVTQASTLLITGAPTEATRNYALNVEDGSVRFALAGPHVIGGVPQNFVQYAINGTFVSGGVSIQAYGIRLSTNLAGASGDTLRLAGMDLASIITTQTAANTITDIAQLSVTEPNITDNLTGGGLITNASTVLILGAPTEGVSNFALRVTSGDTFLGGNLAVSGAGPHAIAGTPSGIIGLIISETFTSDGSGTLASGVFITQTLVGASGDTTSLTGVTFISAITTQTETENIANISQVEINEPFVTDNLTGDITNAQSLLIVNAPTEGLSNFALRVASGLTLVQALEIDGALDHDGSTVGFFGTTPATQPAAYTRNAAIVEDRTLLASASATILNNNNVLAALIADLQSLGVIQ